jgi:methyl-accepting chemotaxis protein
MTRRIVNATQEQARGGELINNASERMSEIAYRVKGSTRAQAEANRQITKTVDDVSRIVMHINNVMREQSRNILRVLEMIDSVRGVSVENIEKASETRKVVEDMVRLNNELREGVKRFKLKK